MITDYLRESEFKHSPREWAKSSLRHELFQMPEEELQGIEQAIREVWNETVKSIEQVTGQPLWEAVAEQAAARVADGRMSIETLREYVSRIAPDWADRAEMVRCLQVHFPAETFEPVKFKQQYSTTYKNEAIKAYEKHEARHADLVWKIDCGEASAAERLEELLLRVELETAEVNWGGDYVVEERLRQQRIEAIIWFLGKLLRPFLAMPRGAATTPMKEHEAAAIAARGLMPLLDCLGS